MKARQVIGWGMLFAPLAIGVLAVGWVTCWQMSVAVILVPPILLGWVYLAETLMADGK